ncbi:SCO3374 family protein [Streptomyces sp. NPDC093260]|uniref:SCO3374 family protein n=1 Tax=Streptomyces sp. NPDC093260 TaxID=3155073 RepID=UPI00343AACA2
MVGSPSTVPVPLPPPRRPPDSGAGHADDGVRRWYEDTLGWATAPGTPVRLVVGDRFDLLDVPLEAGIAALRHLGPGSPAAVQGDRMRLPVAVGAADELPGLLEWLEWGVLDPGLVGLGAGTLMDAPAPPGARPLADGPLPSPEGGLLPGARPSPGGWSPADASPSRERGPVAGGPPVGSGVLFVGRRGTAVWVRPPVPGRAVEPSLPALSALGGGGEAPDLVRLVTTLATECHRLRLREAAGRRPVRT